MSTLCGKEADKAEGAAAGTERRQRISWRRNGEIKLGEYERKISKYENMKKDELYHRERKPKMN